MSIRTAQRAWGEDHLQLRLDPVLYPILVDCAGYSGASTLYPTRSGGADGVNSFTLINAAGAYVAFDYIARVSGKHTLIYSVQGQGAAGATMDTQVYARRVSYKNFTTDHLGGLPANILNGVLIPLTSAGAGTQFFKTFLSNVYLDAGDILTMYIARWGGTCDFRFHFPHRWIVTP